MQGPPLLLVDADQSARRAHAAVLRGCGYAVDEAHHGVEGLALARRRAPALVVLDPWPFVSAAARLVEALALSPETRECAILLLTRTSRHRLRTRTPLTRIAAVLGKPCEPGELLAEVRRLLPTPGGRAARVPRFPETGAAAAAPQEAP